MPLGTKNVGYMHKIEDCILEFSNTEKNLRVIVADKHLLRKV